MFSVAKVKLQCPIMFLFEMVALISAWDILIHFLYNNLLRKRCKEYIKRCIL